MAALSKRAEKLLARVRAGHFYRPHEKNLPKAMAELEAAGLVDTVGRVTVVERCYVPSTGYVQYVPEKFS